MRVIVNGETREVPDGASVSELLGILGLDGARVAVELNREVLHRESFPTSRLGDGDRLEIVRLVGGG